MSRRYGLCFPQVRTLQVVSNPIQHEWITSDTVRHCKLNVPIQDPSTHAPRSINQRESERKQVVEGWFKPMPHCLRIKYVLALAEILGGSKKRDLSKETAPDAPPATSKFSGQASQLRSAIIHVK